MPNEIKSAKVAEAMIRLWFLPRGFTLRVFGRIFQVKPIADEMFSQRMDRWRIRILGWSIKLFGKCYGIASKPADKEDNMPLNSSIASFDSGEMLSKMRELSARIQATPNRIVTTTALMEVIREAASKHADRGIVLSATQAPIPLREVLGIPIEHYSTVKECLDRMMNQETGERIQLVLEAIPPECLSHPFYLNHLRPRYV